jgi:hypothetical protein
MKKVTFDIRASSLLKKYVLKIWHLPLGVLIDDIGCCKYLQDGIFITLAVMKKARNEEFRI